MATNTTDGRQRLIGLTAFQRDVLGVLAYTGATYGAAVQEELEQSGWGRINHGRLYPNLDELVEDGYIEKGKIDDRTNRYELTKRGRRAVKAQSDWLAGKRGAEA